MACTPRHGCRGAAGLGIEFELDAWKGKAPTGGARLSAAEREEGEGGTDRAEKKGVGLGKQEKRREWAGAERWAA